VSALPAEESGNASLCWVSPAVLVRIGPWQRDVEVTWEEQESSFCLFVCFPASPRDNCSVAKFCRVCAMIVVRIIVVKVVKLATGKVCTFKECLKGYKYVNLELVHSYGVVSIHKHEWLAVRIAVLRFKIMLNSHFCTD